LSKPEGRNQRVWNVVSCIPRGRVATYKQIAALAGIEGPTGARQVGFALAALDPDSDVPWHRVINVKGTISPRGRDGPADEQYDRLAVEGVGFDSLRQIDLDEFEWDYC
jgi:methylated-DNA-protein-cysteine methyltransferase related protein